MPVIMDNANPMKDPWNYTGVEFDLLVPNRLTSRENISYLNNLPRYFLYSYFFIIKIAQYINIK